MFLLPGSSALIPEREIKVLFVGDMMFDRYIRGVSEEKGGDYIFSCIDNFLTDFDLIVGNLEGPITDNTSVSEGSIVESPENFVFTFPLFTAKLLKKHNIELVNLGNNHISNFGKEGIDSTHDYLERAGVNYFGGITPSEPIYRTSVRGNKLSFISYNQFGGQSRDVVADKIKEQSRGGRRVIIYTHWGDEYSMINDHMRSTAKLFAQAGANIIVGSHPHITLPNEKVGDATAYYSLGNFIFDQYWNEEVSTGLIVELRIKGDRVETVEHKIVMGRDARTCLQD